LSCNLEMEQVRFSDRLAVTYAVSPAVLPALIPHLLLQPLVENAVRHGLSAGGQGRLHIQADRRDEQLVLEVRDSGPGPIAAGPWGVGLTNSEQRLRALYGDRYVLALHPRAGPGYECTPGTAFSNLSNALTRGPHSHTYRG